MIKTILNPGLDKPVHKKEVASFFNRSTKWVESAVRKHGMPCLKLTRGTVLFNLNDVMAWAKNRAVKTKATA